jgi:hypothetical protein
MSSPDFNDPLERELRAFRPVQPSAGLEQRLAAAIESLPEEPNVSQPGSMIRFLPWTLIAAATLAVVLFRPDQAAVLNPGDGSPAATVAAVPLTANLVPVSAENLLFGAEQDEGIFMVGGAPARRMRLHYLDTTVWEDRTTGQTVRFVQPREEIRLVSLATY